ncbi:MAG TPA: FAD-binding protein [Desulfobacterales bacterium]
MLVIGGGGAGLRAAIAAGLKNAAVLLVSKTKAGANSNTYISKAVIASTGWGSEDDNRCVHIEDTVVGGRFLNDQAMVAGMAEQVRAEVAFLKKCGVRFELHGGKPKVIKTPGHRYPRHVYGRNWRGSDLVVPLKRFAEQAGVRFAEHVFVSRLIADGKRIGGAAGIAPDGRFYEMRAKVVVLATGGYAQIYLNTNNVPGITGDGQALAYDIGIPLKDMEFVQFYPTATGKRGNRLILYERLLAQPDVVLRNGSGQDILKHCGIDDPTKVTRDRFAQIIYREMNRKESRDPGVFMDMESLSEETAGKLAALIPNRWWQGTKVFNVMPTAHFCMGGIVTNPFGETALDGLFAVGEAAAGVHGANRLGGNALAEIFAMGARVGELAAAKAADMRPVSGDQDAFNQERRRLEGTYSIKGSGVKELIGALKSLMWNKAGVIRNEKDLRTAMDQLRTLGTPVKVTSPRDLIRRLEFQNMRCVAEMVCRAALMRTESRGAHFRSDFPQEDHRNWIQNIVLKKNKSGFHVTTEPVNLNLVKMNS